MALLGAFLLTMLLSGVGKAQIAGSYPIFNSLTCDVEITWKVYNVPGCTYVCHNTQVIPAGLTINIPAACSGGAGHDIYILVNWVDSSSNPAIQQSLATPYSNCSPGGNNVTVSAPTAPCTMATIAANATGAIIY